MNPASALLIIGGIGFQEILIILVILLLLFGGRKIPELARGLGRGITEFKRGVHDPTNEKISEKASKPDDGGQKD